MATPKGGATGGDGSPRRRRRCALPGLQRAHLAHVQRLQRVRLLLHGVRGHGSDAQLCGCRVQAARHVAAREDPHRHRRRALCDAAVGEDADNPQRPAARAVDGAAPGRGALSARLARLPTFQGVLQDRIWHVRGADARAALLVRLPAAPLSRWQDERGGERDGRQHGQARPGTAGRGARHPAAPARLGGAKGGAAGGGALGVCRKGQGEAVSRRHAPVGAL